MATTKLKVKEKPLGTVTTVYFYGPKGNEKVQLNDVTMWFSGKDGEEKWTVFGKVINLPDGQVDRKVAAAFAPNCVMYYQVEDI